MMKRRSAGAARRGNLEELVDEADGTSKISLAARLDFPLLRTLFGELL
jgi:hypothetical protein